MMNFNFDGLEIKDILNPNVVNDYMRNNYQVNNNQPKCEYCNSIQGTIECQCGRIFCNGMIQDSQACHIVQHMRLNKHFSIKLNGIQLKCRSCEQTNIYHLKYSNQSEEVICVECLEKESEEIKQYFNEKVFVDGKLLLSDVYGIQKSNGVVNMDYIDQIERKYPKDEVIGMVKLKYTSKQEYCELYKKLSAIEKREEVKVE